MEKYYTLDEKYNNPEVHDRINKIAEIKKDLLKSLEDLRKDKIIKTSLEADIKVFAKEESTRKLMSEMGEEELRRFLQVAKVVITESDSGLTAYDSSAISTSKSEGTKCIRCWNFFDKLGSDPEHPELCLRCTTVVKNI